MEQERCTTLFAAASNVVKFSVMIATVMILSPGWGRFFSKRQLDALHGR
jgi:hypothetical protein